MVTIEFNFKIEPPRFSSIRNKMSVKYSKLAMLTFSPISLMNPLCTTVLILNFIYPHYIIDYLIACFPNRARFTFSEIETVDYKIIQRIVCFSMGIIFLRLCSFRCLNRCTAL